MDVVESVVSDISARSNNFCLAEATPPPPMVGSFIREGIVPRAAGPWSINYSVLRRRRQRLWFPTSSVKVSTSKEKQVPNQCDQLDRLFVQICQLVAITICPMAKIFSSKVGLKFCQLHNKPKKYLHNRFKIYPKWRQNFTKSGHTGSNSLWNEFQSIEYSLC